MNTAVEDVKSRINIVDLIGEYVKLQKAGSNWKAPCPFHREKSPSFMVSEEKQIWHCFGCSKGGDAFGFVMEMESFDFKEALRFLAGKAGVDLSQYQKSHSFTPEAKPNRGLEILELAAKFYEKQLWDGVGRTKILEYLRNRGLKDETIREFRIGYAPIGWQNMLDFLLKRNYALEEISSTGLLVQKSSDESQSTGSIQQQQSRHYDRFRDRIIFPIQDAFGRVVGFTARVAPGGDETQAKYVNTPETYFYHKGRVLYGLDKAKREIKNQGEVLIVEGNMDVIASHQAGIRNTVAVSGTALTPEQLDILKRYAENIKLLFDMDAAGEEAIRRSAELCFQKDLNVSVVRLEGGKDAAEIVQKDPQLLLGFVGRATHAMDYILQALLKKYDRRKPEGKKAIARESLAFVGQFRSEIEKQHWLRIVAEKIQVEENTLAGVLQDIGSKRVLGGTAEKYTGHQTDFSVKERSDAIAERVVGIMLAEPASWEWLAGGAGSGLAIWQHPLVQAVIAQGREAEFRLEKLLNRMTDDEARKNLQKLFFEAKFQVAVNGAPVENDLSDAKIQIEKYSTEFEREENRKKLQLIVQDIRKAEESGDAESLKMLIAEFNNLSKLVR